MAATATASVEEGWVVATAEEGREVVWVEEESVVVWAVAESVVVWVEEGREVVWAVVLGLEAAATAADAAVPRRRRCGQRRAVVRREGAMTATIGQSVVVHRQAMRGSAVV